MMTMCWTHASRTSTGLMEELRRMSIKNRPSRIILPDCACDGCAAWRTASARLEREDADYRKWQEL